MRRWILRIALLLAAGLALAVGVVTWISEGVGGHLQGRGEVAAMPLPAPLVAERAARQPAGPDAAQILFGDLHVHTTYSGDAFVFSLPLMQGEGAHPPADACDFARFCSALDFWSINDHAEHLTPRMWEETKESIRECNAVTEAANPDTVAFLGWEWTQSAPAALGRGTTHYGHKNVIFRGTDDAAVPARPIGAGSGGLFEQPIPSFAWALLRFSMTLRDWDGLQPYLDFNRFTREFRSLEVCSGGVPVRDLPADCIEGAETPATLFEKLDDWGFESLVIPHGTAWGIHAPSWATLADQLSVANHDPTRQRLLEVYSGHGSSELYRELRDFVVDDAGNRTCAPPADGYLPCCWRAGELIRERCGDDLPPEICEERVARARQLALEEPSAYGVVAGTGGDDWLECGQLAGSFLPAYDYRPAMSAQYGLALRAGDGSTYRYGLIGSSDNHKARAGPSYKEIHRKAFSDAYGLRRDWWDTLAVADEPLPEPQENVSPLKAMGAGFERGASFYYTAGLVAVHAAGRDRSSIWDALRARRTYATSGDRILLWFDLLNGPGGPTPMGTEVVVDEAPRFEVRALGAFEQLPGCPDGIEESLGAERLQRLCFGECYHPSDERRRIERVEVVRIRKQRGPDEPVAPLVEDPWLVLPCQDEGQGCRVHFEDREPADGRETVYYVRALQEPTPAVNGDPMGCERDESGRCLRARSCPAAGPDFDPEDDCLAPVRERAWSSPIFVSRS